MTNEKIGLVLEGGGVKGAYEAGVLKVLAECGVEFGGAAGTSIGAVNAGLYVEGGAEAVLDMWSEVWAGTVMDIDDELLLRIKNNGFDAESIAALGKRLIKIRSLLQGSYDKTQAFFESKAREDKMRASGKQLGLVTYCLSDRAPVEALIDEIPNGKLVDLLIASATFPIFPPKEIDGKKYIDGGVYNNLPINLLARGGFEKQLVIRTNPADKKPRCREPIREDLELFYIVPQKELAHVMEFTSSKVAELMKKGAEDARRALDGGLAEFLGIEK